MSIRHIFLALLACASLLGPPACQADTRVHAAILNQDRCLDLYRPQSKETARFCYWRVNGGFQRDGYMQAVHILRDVKYGQQAYIDPNLLDVLFLIQAWLNQEGRQSQIHILSGYRTAEHNFRLEGAAKQSLHMKGMAADIYIPELNTKVLALMSRYVGAGGVGVYIDKNFIHVDTGRLRHWRG